jgi:hypothetical protein
MVDIVVGSSFVTSQSDSFLLPFHLPVLPEQKAPIGIHILVTRGRPSGDCNANFITILLDYGNV